MHAVIILGAIALGVGWNLALLFAIEHLTLEDPGE